MAGYEETRAVLFQSAVGVGELPTPEDTWNAVLDLYANSIKVQRSARAKEAAIHFLRDGQFVITLPLTSDEWAEAYMLSHEWGHAVLATEPVPMGPSRRLNRRNLRASEAEVQRFVDAWWLPRATVERWRPEDLAWETRCDAQALYRRRQQISRGLLDIPSEGPPWCARRVFNIKRVMSPAGNRFELRASLPERVKIEIPFNPASQISTLYTLETRLLALRPEEFLRLYQGDVVEVGQLMRIPVWDLLRGRATVGR